MFTSRLNLTIILFLSLIAACAAPQNGASQSINVRAAQIQNERDS